MMRLAYGSLQDFKTLKPGDVIVIEGSGFKAKVVGVPFYNADADEPGWEVETNNGTISIYNDILVEA